MKFTVAIDGPAAAGKGTVARSLAKHFGFAYLDTGLLYRAVGQKALGGMDAVVAAQTLQPEDMLDPNLRTRQVAQAASQVAVNAGVRAALLAFQRNFSRRDGGAVLDGRDIGTVICPDAEVKLFVTANDRVRAQRRYGELCERGLDITLAQVSQDLKERDARDSGRENAPTKRADGAHLLDTSDLSIDQALAMAIGLVQQAIDEPG